MSHPEGKVLAHITQKSFNHPGITSRIIQTLHEVEDPRQRSCNFRHSLVTIILKTAVKVQF